MWNLFKFLTTRRVKALKQRFTAASLTSETLLIEVRKGSALPVAAKGASEIKG